MNIFYLHHLPAIAAAYHADKHVGKMLIEYTGLTANGRRIKRWRMEDPVMESTLYKASHANHPSAIWVRASRLHYDYTAELAMHLGRQFYLRYGTSHKSRQVLSDELLIAPPAMYDLPLTWSPPTLAMPDEYKSVDAIASYRRYYASKAATMPLVYDKGRSQQPLWLRDLLVEEVAA